MKHFLIMLMFLSTSCELFRSQQQDEKSVTTEAKPEEVFVPVEKELYVITHTAMEYAKPNMLVQPKEELNSFGALFEIEAESEHFYKIKGVSDRCLRKEDMGSYEDIQFTKEALEGLYTSQVLNARNVLFLCRKSRFRKTSLISTKRYYVKEKKIWQHI